VTATDFETDERSAPELVRNLFRAVLSLARSTARMLGAEAREVTRRIGRRVALLIASSVVTAAGVLLVLAGAALVVETRYQLPRWAALLAVGGVALVAGAAGIGVAIRRLGSADLAFPETVAEIGKDIDALQDRGRAP
jgi:uncharacterized membrane protein YqjE